MPGRPEADFDFRNPDYGAVFKARIERLNKIRENPTMLPGLFAYYRDNPADFITDFGVTYDPRNIERGLPAMVPFILMPRQREWVEWVVAKWRGQESGLVEKTRDMGMSWLSIATACTLCNFHDGMTFGFGSRKEEYVDKLGHPKSLFYKARMFMENLPPEFRRGWTRADAPHMRISFPATGSVLTGEAGDNIGRGDRASIYFVDEAAFLERPQLVEASLSATTNCRIDISTPNGTGNPFWNKRFKIYKPEQIFTFHWRSDSRKDEAWYAKQVAELDPVTVAQEIDINYSASVEGVLIPSEWVQSAVNADRKLGFTITGAKRAALDVADEGRDKNALCIGQGIAVEQVPEWSGKGSDILGTVQKAFALCDDADVTDMRFDSDGLGAGVRGDARVLNENREVKLRVSPWRGSAAVAFPDKAIPTANPGQKRDRTNKDYFANAKAQGWWELRVRFQRTHRAVTEKDYKYDPDDLIVLREGLGGLYSELSQPTYTVNTAGKIIVDKAPDGTPSPNKADSVMIWAAPRQGGAYEMNL